MSRNEYTEESAMKTHRTTPYILIMCLCALLLMSAVMPAAAAPVLSVELNQTTVADGGTISGRVALSENLEITYLVVKQVITDQYGNEMVWNEYNCTKTKNSDNSYTISLEVRPGVKGQLKLQATYRDSDGEWVNAYAQSAYFTIVPGQGDTSAPGCTFKLDKTSVARGETITATYTLTDGTSGYTVSTALVEDARGKVTLKNYPFTGEGIISFTPSHGVSACFVLVMDNEATHERIYYRSSWFTITGAEEPFSADISLQPATLTHGQPARVLWTGQNGVAPYTLKFVQITYYEEPDAQGKIVHQLSLDADNPVFTPVIGASCRIYISVEDATGNYAFDEAWFSISGTPQVAPLACNIQLSHNYLYPGDKLTATWTITGGRQPYRSVSVYFDDDNQTSFLYPDASGEYAVFAKASSAYYQLQLIVYDADGWYETFVSERVPVKNNRFTFSLSETTVKVGKPLTLTVQPKPTPVVVNYTYMIRWYQQDMIRKTQKLAGEGAVSSTFTPAQEGEGFVTIDVSKTEDPSTVVARTRLDFTVAGDVSPLQVNLNLDKTVAAAGQTVTGSWTIAGGQAPYTVNDVYWIIDEGDPDHELHLDGVTGNKTSSLKVNAGRRGVLALNVRDALGREVIKKSAFTITGAPPHTYPRVTCSLNRQDVAVGQDITASWTITGGVQPFTCKAAWVLFDKDEGYGLLTRNPSGTSSTLTVSPAVSGQFELSVTDAAGVVSHWRTGRFNVLPPVPDLPGDANGDSAVDIRDLVSIINFIVSGRQSLSMTNADANGDGYVDIRDLVWIINRIVSD